MIPAPSFKTEFLKYAHKPYLLGLVADQNAGSSTNAYWTNFFGKPAPFVKGPEKGAKKLNTAVVMAHYYKLKRGHYQLGAVVITENPKEMQDGEISKLHTLALEKNIQKQPAFWLWSHRRWKHKRPFKT